MNSRYHGHVEAQREDAFFGPLIVEPQFSRIAYDDEKIVMISDFYYDYGNVQLLKLESTPFRWVGSPQHLLVNGQLSHTITVRPGKVYLFRFISAAALSWWVLYFFI
jgi:FtsP/CotA-like multicopper oxidase with cupredoxin domain